MNRGRIVLFLCIYCCIKFISIKNDYNPDIINDLSHRKFSKKKMLFS